MFFQHYAACYVRHFKNSGIAQGKKTGAMAASMMGALGGAAVQREMKQQMDAQIKQLTDQANKKLADYEQNKATLNKAAFAVLDVNKDGKLQQEEVVTALTPHHTKNVEFHLALGLMTQLEAQMAGLLGSKEEKSEGGGCSMQ